MAKTLYFNIEDDVKSVTARVRQEASSEVLLVFPRRSYVFSDALNLKLLKKQLDVLGKTAVIMTMDERGQAASKEAGFALQAPQPRKASSGMGDVVVKRRPSERAGELSAVPTAVADTVRVPAEPVQADAVVPAMAAITAAPKAATRVVVHDTIFSDVPKRPRFEGYSTASASRGRFHGLTVWLGATALLALVAVVVFTVLLPRAQIVVYAKSEPVARDLEITVSTHTTQSSVSTLSLPGFAVDKAVQAEDKFQVVGKKEVGSKASGKVRIFNLTGVPINLKKTTTTLSANGRTFVFTTDQNYIAAVSAQNVSSPSAGVVAEVAAQEGGELSNLPEGTRLEITNQVFGNKPQLLYAQAEEPFTGGNSRFVSVIEAQDLTVAEEALTQKAAAQITTEAKAEGKFLAERAFQASEAIFTPEMPVGTESPAFTAKYSARFRAVTFDPVELTNLVRSRIEQVLPESSHLGPVEGDAMTFEVRSLDVDAGQLKLVVHVQSRVFQDLDVEPFQDQLTGKSKEAAEKLLAGDPGVERVTIAVWPSWRQKMPRLSSRIELTEKEE